MAGVGAPMESAGWRRVVPQCPEYAGALVAAALVAVLTRHGVLLDPDSPSYLFTARLLRDDPARLVDLPTDTTLSIRGLFPPGYPVALALLGGGLGAARVLGVVAAALSTALSIRLVRRLVGPAPAVAAAAVIAATRGSLLVLFGFVMSDGLHVVLLVAGLSIVVPALDAPALGRRTVVGLAAVGALAVLTRYVAIGTAAGLALALVLFGRAPARSRWRTAIVIGSGALGAGVAWTALLASSGGAGTRTPGFQPLAWADLRPVLQYPLFAVLPRPVLDALGTTLTTLVGSGVVAVAVLWAVRLGFRARRPGAASTERAAAACVTVAATYTAALLAARLFFDRMIPLDGRYALPVVFCVVLGFAVDRGAPDAGGRRVPTRALVAGVVAVLALSSVALGRSLAEPTEAWSNLGMLPPSPLARYGAGLEPDVILVTNREDVVFVETGRTTRSLPAPTDFYTGRPVADYPAELERLARSVRAGRVVLLVFADQPGAAETPDVIAGRTGLRIRQFADGAALEP